LSITFIQGQQTTAKNQPKANHAVYYPELNCPKRTMADWDSYKEKAVKETAAQSRKRIAEGREKDNVSIDLSNDISSVQSI
jgi:hypothetical protein